MNASVLEALSLAPKVAAAPPAAVHIEATGVSKQYGAKGVLALDQVSLSVREGEFLSILGPSGCGKSTLLRCVAGLERPTGGEIRVHGEPVRKPPANMGVVFQRDVLLEWRSILDNMFLQVDFRGEPRGRYMERAHELLDLFGLKGFEKAFPAQLSGGMRQRAAICRALLANPDLLLMDEPFGALDALTRDQMNLELQKIWSASRRTILFVTHSIGEAVFLSDRVVVMSPRPGRIAMTLTIDLPRPRRMMVREMPEFALYCGQIRALFGDMGLLKDE
ncbi:ABC transporter ATP-binding protein [Acidisphaera sp. S103]|uniref:ABC transporter ATP-binding protein n=1 Tax=Acidisphaera sp. S103 TaxID=1747223 RepID=UPI00131AD8B3|nr:ABC transporter ATP-binding protein [Acidisphaera sp. S103]